MGEDLHTELRHAAIDGQLDRCKQLVKKGADVNKRNEHQNTALHLAALYGQLPVIQYILTHKPDLDATNTNGQTALQIACMKGHLDIVKTLTQHTCTLDMETEFSGFTALHFASNAGHAAICQHLLDCGATEEIKDFADQIPEFYAANEPTEEVFRKRKPKSPKPQAKASRPKTNSPPPKPPKSVTPPPKPETPPQKPETPPPKPETPPPKTETPPPKPETPPPKTETPPPKEVSPPPKPQSPPHSPIPEPKVKATAEVVESHSKERQQPKEGERRKRDGWTPVRNKVSIHNGLSYNFKHDGMKFDHKKKEGNIQKLKNHEFEWSEDFKERSRQSVFDRLGGGGGSKKADPKKTAKK